MTLENIRKYVIFLRILFQDKIANEDLDYADELIVDFIQEYQTLYGVNVMTSNIHKHMHLTNIVRRYGPLHKLSCFPFEGVFKISRSMFHGTVNFDG